MRKYERIKDIYFDIENIKRAVKQMNKYELRVYKDCFYSLNLKSNQLDLLWEYIWDYTPKYQLITELHRHRVDLSKD